MLSAAIANPPDYITIRSVGHMLGHNGLRHSNRLAARIQVHLAGYAAEHMLTGRPIRQLRHEVGLALLARINPTLREEFEHCEERDGFRVVEDLLRTAMLDDSEVWREVDRFYGYTRESLTAAWTAVERVAKALLKGMELDRAAFDALTDDIDLYGMVRPLQRKHGLLPPFASSVAASATTVMEASVIRPAARTKRTTKAVPMGLQPDDARVVSFMKALRRDSKLAPVVAAYEKTANAKGRKFGSNGLKVGGKLFALFTRGTLVVKLPKARVATLVAEHVGKPFEPRPGRLMKEWLTVTSPKAAWTDLAREAYKFVARS